jgi:hypothetical protein
MMKIETIHCVIIEGAVDTVICKATKEKIGYSEKRGWVTLNVHLKKLQQPFKIKI